MYDAFGKRYSMQIVGLYQLMMVELKKKLDAIKERRD